MNAFTKIASGSAVAVLAVGGLALSTGPAQADGGGRHLSQSQAQAKFDPRLEKVNYTKILAQADNVNRTDTIKLLRERKGNWDVVKTWTPDNARNRDFAEVVSIKGGVGRLSNYMLRVIDHQRGHHVTVADS